jgi:hypothetical protein
MDKKFTICPHCGTRNFAEDMVCGICGTPLSSTAVSSKKTEQGGKTSILKPILIVAGSILVLYFLFIYKRDDSSIGTKPGIQMAIIHEQSKNPEEATVILFDQYLTALQKRYALSSRQDIANAVVSAYNLLIKNGGAESLLEFTGEFVAFSNQLDEQHKVSLSQGLAVFLKLGYRLGG